MSVPSAAHSVLRTVSVPVNAAAPSSNAYRPSDWLSDTVIVYSGAPWMLPVPVRSACLFGVRADRSKSTMPPDETVTVVPLTNDMRPVRVPPDSSVTLV